LPSHAAQDFVIFYHEDCSAFPFRTDALHLGRGSSTDFVLRAGQINPERRSLPWFAVDQDVARALLDNAVYRGQAQTRSFAHLFGGEEGLEDARYGGFIHAGAGVAHRKQNIFPHRHGLLLFRKSLVKSHITGFKNKLAAMRHGVASVHREVDYDLVELAGVRLDHRRL
jgi:hypothetical protein